MYNPAVLGDVNGILGAINMGNAVGGTNWPGVAYDPETHNIIANANNAGITATSLVTPPPSFSDIRYVSGVAGRPFQEVIGPGDCCAADSPRAIAQAQAQAQPRRQRPAAAARLPPRRRQRAAVAAAADCWSRACRSSSRRTARSRRSTSIAARSSGRCRTATRRTTCAIIRR